MAQTLVSKIKTHCTAQGSQGAKTLELTAVCIKHMRDNQGEWTPLVTLIGMSQPAQGRIVRKIAERVLQGYNIGKDDKQDSGLRVSKVKDVNQGYDETVLRKLDDMIDAKATLQGAVVKDYFFPASTTVWSVDTYAATIAKKAVKEGSDINALIAALMAIQAAEAEAAKIAA